jgi:hypothetical protein
MFAFKGEHLFAYFGENAGTPGSKTWQMITTVSRTDTSLHPLSPRLRQKDRPVGFRRS